MTLHDDDHEAARMLKDLEQRVTDLEEEPKTDATPNLLLTKEETIGVGDQLRRIVAEELETGVWGETGWNKSTWGGWDYEG